MTYKHAYLERRITKLERAFNLLNEAKQVGTLYHVCTLEAYLKYILPNDELKASGKYYNYLYKRDDVISFTRDKYFTVDVEDITSNVGIILQLVIDGDRLSEKYKIGPYNSMAYADPDIQETSPEFREMEECVIGPIKNISKYIKDIYFDVLGIDGKVLATLKSLIKYNFKYRRLGYTRDDSLKAFKKREFKDGDSIRECYEKLKSEYTKFMGDVDAFAAKDNLEAICDQLGISYYKDGYYTGKKSFNIHVDLSDKAISRLISKDTLRKIGGEELEIHYVYKTKLLEIFAVGVGIVKKIVDITECSDTEFANIIRNMVDSSKLLN